MKSIYLPLLVFCMIFASCSDDGQQLLDIINEELPDPEPGEIDTDGDGVLDTDEANHGTDAADPCSFILASQTVAPTIEWDDADCDEDGVSNSVEVNDATDPLVADTDNDGVSDGVEKEDNTNPLVADTDGDGVTDGVEKNDTTDPNSNCSFVLANQDTDPNTAWNAADCDSDGVNNQDELADNTNPLNQDSDGDGVIDGTEKSDGTSANNGCSLVVANQTVSPSTTWNNGDCDQDGTSNGQEIANGTDPLTDESEPEPPVSPLAGTWNLTDATITNGTATTSLDGTDITISFTSASSNENVNVTFAEGPNTLQADGTYTTTISFTIFGTDYTDVFESQSPLSSGTWAVNGSNLVVTANDDVDGSYEILENTATTLRLRTDFSRVITLASGLVLDTTGSLEVTFTK